MRGDWIVFDQLERVRSVALYSDLYAVRAGGGPVRRLTKNARAGDPDLSPDGRRIVCTVQATGRRALALLDFTPAASGTRPVADRRSGVGLHRAALVTGRPPDRGRAAAPAATSWC